DGKTYQVIFRVDPLDDADNVRYDPVAKKVWVGYGGGALAEIDAATGKKLAEVKLAGHPESFQLEKKGPRIFVNGPSAGNVTVIDRAKHRVIATWHVGSGRANFPMALDERETGFLYIGCRKPAEVIVLSVDPGTPGMVVNSHRIAGDTDNLFIDPDPN